MLGLRMQRQLTEEQQKELDEIAERLRDVFRKYDKNRFSASSPSSPPLLCLFSPSSPPSMSRTGSLAPLPRFPSLAHSKRLNRKMGTEMDI